MESTRDLVLWAVRWQPWVPIAVFAAASAWEACSPDRRRVLGRGWRWGTNIGLYFGDGRAMAAIAPFALGAALLTLLHVPHLAIFVAIRDHLGPWSELIAGCLVLDFIGYLLHRLSHRYFTLWRLHAVHHADLDVDASTAVRHHPIEVILNGMAQVLLVLFLGLPIGAVAVYAVLAISVQLLQHANLRLPTRLEAALGWLIMTPALHRTHHSVSPEHYNANFGTVLSVWDRLLGTLTPPMRSGPDAPGFGVEPFRELRHARPHWALLLPFVMPRQQPTVQPTSRTPAARE